MPSDGEGLEMACTTTSIFLSLLNHGLENNSGQMRGEGQSLPSVCVP